MTPPRTETPLDCRTLLARYHTELWENRNYAVIDELFHPEYRGAGLEQGAADVPAAIKAMLAAFLSAFSDFHAELDMLFGEGDRACIQWTLSGTHTGDLWGMPPTGKSFRVQGMDIFVAKDGKFVRQYGGFPDQVPKILAQLGLSGPPA